MCMLDPQPLAIWSFLPIAHFTVNKISAPIVEYLDLSKPEELLATSVKQRLLNKNFIRLNRVKSKTFTPVNQKGNSLYELCSDCAEVGG